VSFIFGNSKKRYNEDDEALHRINKRSNFGIDTFVEIEAEIVKEHELMSAIYNPAEIIDIEGIFVNLV
jgi:hypothetical protein